MILSKKEVEGFKKAAEPLMKWMAENLHPHTTAIVDQGRAELLEGKCAHVTEEFILD